MNIIFQDWLDAKKAEEKATEERRKIEDEMVELFKVPKTFEGTSHVRTSDQFNVRIIGRMTRKVNAEKLQWLAAEHGLSGHLATLFRWKPEVIVDKWAAADPSITQPLLDAVTTTNTRPTFKITPKE